MERQIQAFQAHIMSNMKTVLVITINIAGVVGIVVLMKQLFQTYEFNYPVFLVVLHQLTTAFVLWLMTTQGLLEPKALDKRIILQLALGEIGSIVFSNWSLMHNSVGMYQIFKLLNIPFMCVVETFMLKSTFSNTIKLSLVVILGGIAMATVTDVQYNSVGLMHGLSAVLATSFYQVLVKRTTKDKDLSGLQLSYCTALPKAGILAVLVPVLEKNPGGLLAFDYTTVVLSIIFMTCILGVIAVTTPAMIIQSTTPVTFQVVGHAKTCLIILSGFIFFQQPFVAKNVTGVLVALAGMIWYSYLKMPQPKPEVAPDDEEIPVPPPPPPREDECVAPLGQESEGQGAVQRHMKDMKE
jgi:solute carrier family 35 protein E3